MSDLTSRCALGLHTGLVYRVPDINGAENVSGAGINFAQRVMDCGDAGHILMSEVHASFLCEFDALRPHLHDLGEAEVKHGVPTTARKLFRR
jgi:class 3 adenylate cyclase